MKDDTNITTKVIIAATMTASCVALDDHKTFRTEAIPSAKFTSQYKNKSLANMLEKYKADGTSTALWSKQYYSLKRERLDENQFILDIGSFDTMNISQILFSNSRELDNEMALALERTVDKIGKDSTNLPNRL